MSTIKKIYQPKDDEYMMKEQIASFEVWSSKEACLKSCPDLTADDIAEYDESDIESYSLID